MKTIYSIRIMILFLMVLIQSPPTVVAGGFGVSGTFAGHDYKMVVGETSSTSNISVIFFNQYDVDITIRLNTEGPLGVTFLNLQDQYSIPANSQLRIPISIQLDSLIAPGSYVLNVYAQVLPSSEEGITLIGSAGLQANLVVLGEAGMLDISVISVNGNPIPAVIELFRVEEETLINVALSDDGIVGQFAAADYLVKVYFESKQVAETLITLENQDEIILEIVAQTLVIQRFRVVPDFINQSELLSTSQIYYELDNVFKPVNDVSVVLRVMYQTSLIEEVEILLASVINTGSTRGQFTFFPEQGWKAGDYSFELVLSNPDNVLDFSDTLTYNVPRTAVDSPGLFEGRTSWLIAAIIFASTGFIAVGWFVFRSKPTTPAKRVEKTTTFSQGK